MQCGPYDRELGDPRRYASYDEWFAKSDSRSTVSGLIEHARRPEGAPRNASRQGCPLDEMPSLSTSRNAPPEELKPLGPVIHT